MIENSIVIANTVSGPMPPTTNDWIAENFPAQRRFKFDHPVPVIQARNQVVRAALTLAEDAEWAWFIDNDVTITHPGLGRWLQVAADVVACDCQMDAGDVWKDEDAFHNAFWRCRVTVLKTIVPPWFELPVSADGCDILDCECSFFAAKARAAGFTIRHGGWCGHANVRSWKHKSQGV